MHGVPCRWASSENLNADLWREALRLQRDHEELPLAVKVTAHQSRSAAEAGDSDVERGLRRWQGNEAADQHAKSLARRIAQLKGKEEQLGEHHAIIKEVLKRVAIGAAWQLRNGTAAIVTKQKRRRAKAQGHSSAGEKAHEHDVHARQGGGWECRRCKGYAVSRAGMRNLATRPCMEVEREQVHPTHMLSRTNGIIWCQRCGCYTSRWPRELQAHCKGKPASVAQHNVRRRLELGLPPTTASYLDDAMVQTPQAYATEDGFEATAPAHGRANIRARSSLVGLYLRLPGGLWRGPQQRPAPASAPTAFLGEETNVTGMCWSLVYLPLSMPMDVVVDLFVMMAVVIILPVMSMILPPSTQPPGPQTARIYLALGSVEPFCQHTSPAAHRRLARCINLARWR